MTLSPALSPARLATALPSAVSTLWLAPVPRNVSVRAEASTRTTSAFMYMGDADVLGVCAWSCAAHASTAIVPIHRLMVPSHGAT